VVARLAAGKAVASWYRRACCGGRGRGAHRHVEDWLYPHAKTLPFTSRLGRAVRFDEAALTRWLATRGR